MKNKIIFIAILFVAVLMTVIIRQSVSRNILILENVSDKTILSAVITVCGQVYRLDSISAGEQKELQFDVVDDGDIQVDVDFQDGTHVSETFGDVTEGEYYRVDLQVESDVIQSQ